MSPEVRSLIDYLAGHPNLQKRVAKNPKLFEGDACVRILTFVKDDAHFASDDLARSWALSTKVTWLRAAAQRDRPLSVGPVAFADAILKTIKKPAPRTVFHPNKFPVFPSGNRRLDAAARAIAEWELDGLPYKFGTVFPIDGARDENRMMSAISHLQDRLEEGVRATHLFTLFAGDGPADAIAVMIHHFAGVAFRGSPDEIEACKALQRKLKAVGLLDHAGKPDFMPPTAKPDADAMRALDSKTLGLARTLANEVAQWETCDASVSIMNFSIPDHWTHAELLKLREAGLVTVMWQGTATLEGDTFVAQEPFLETVWAVSSSARPLLAELNAHAPVTEPKEASSAIDQHAYEYDRDDRMLFEVVTDGSRFVSAGTKGSLKDTVLVGMVWTVGDKSLWATRSISLIDGSISGPPRPTWFLSSSDDADDSGLLEGFKREAFGRDFDDASTFASKAEGDERFLAFAVADHLPALRSALAEHRAREALSSFGYELYHWGQAASSYDRRVEQRDDALAAVKDAVAAVAAFGRKAKPDQDPEEKIDTALGVLRIVARGDKDDIHILPSKAASKRHQAGTLVVYDGNWAAFRRDGYAMSGNVTFRGVSARDAALIISKAIDDYLTKRPSAFDEARLVLKNATLEQAEFELSKIEATEADRWAKLQKTYDHVEKVLDGLEHLTPEQRAGLPPLVMPEDPYDRDAPDSDAELEELGSGPAFR